MAAPEDGDLENAAAKALLPNVQQIRAFFELSRDMEQVRWLTREFAQPNECMISHAS